MNKKIISSILSVLLIFTSIFSSTPAIIRADDEVSIDETVEAIEEEWLETEGEEALEEDLPVEIEGEEIVEEAETTSSDDVFEIPPLTYRTTDKDPSLFEHRNYKNKSSVHPAKFSLVDLGYVTSVKNQNPYGTCWTFSTMGSAESIYLKKTGKTLDLSELQLAWFTYNSAGIPDSLGLITYDGGDGVKTALDEGGNDEMATASLASGIGAIKEEKVPYRLANDTKTSISSEYCYDTDYILTDAVYLSMREKDVIKDFLMNEGALSVSYQHYTDFYNSKNKAYYMPYNDSRSGHAVTLVGWDDNFPASKFNSKYQPAHDGAWLIKNSWGSSWGDKGYFWISYEDANIRYGVAAGYFIEPTDDSMTNIYQYDGSAYPSGRGYYISSQPYKAACVYTAQNNEILDRASFWIEGTDIQYTIQIYKNPRSGQPDSGSLVSTTSGLVSEGGYHIINLDEIVYLNQGDVFSIVVTARSDDYIAAEYSVSKSQGWYDSSTPSGYQLIDSTSNGQSYEYSFGRWFDDCNPYGEYDYTARIHGLTITDEIRLYRGGLELESISYDKGVTLDLTTNFKAGLSFEVLGDDCIEVIDNGDGTLRINTLEYGTATLLVSFGGYSKSFDVTIKAPIKYSGTIDANCSFIIYESGLLEMVVSGEYTLGSGSAILSNEMAAYVKEIKIAEGTTSIGENAFVNFVNCEKVYLPDSLSSIAVGSLPENAIFVVSTGSFADTYVRYYYPLQVAYAGYITVIYDCVEDDEVFYELYSRAGLISEPDYKPELAGHQFLYWVDDSGNRFDYGSTVAANLVLHAHFGKVINVTYQYNGVSLGLSAKTVVNELPFGTLPTPKKKGYTFTGWVLGEDKVDEKTIVNSEEDLVLEAAFTPNSYTVSFDAGAGSVSIKNITVTFDQPFGDLPKPYLRGYGFAGWYKGDDVLVTASSIVSDDVNITLYAKYKELVVNVSFDAGISSQVFDDTNIEFGSTIASLPTPSVSGHAFIGWYTENGVRVSVGDVFRYENDLTLYANFIESDVLPEDLAEVDGNVPEGLWFAGLQPSVLETGKAITQNFRVYFGHRRLYLGTDYTVSYKNNVKPTTDLAKAEVLVKGKGTYAGTAKAGEFEIHPASLNDDPTQLTAKAFAVTPASLQVDYNGNPHELKVTVSDKANPETTLAEGLDYELSYANNVNKGKATIYVTGINGYRGTISTTFTILQGTFDECMVEVPASWPYSKGGTKPPVVVDGLIQGVDYTVSYKQNVKTMTGTITVKGKGNYKGSATIPFALEVKDLDELYAYADDMVYTGKAKLLPKVSVYDNDGKLLKEKTDYVIAGYYHEDGTPLMATEILSAGDVVCADIVGIGMYEGTKSLKATVVKASIAKASIKVLPKTYQGTPICLKGSDLTVVVSKVLLSEDDYEIEAYYNNTLKGTATVVLKGVGNYGGHKAVSFKIGPHKFS